MDFIDCHLKSNFITIFLNDFIKFIYKINDFYIT